MTTLGTKLRKLRDDKKMSQSEIANILGVSQSAYNKWEADQAKPNTDNLVRIADFHETSIYELLDEKSVIQNNTDQATGTIHHNNNVTINNNLSEELVDTIFKNQEQIFKMIEVQTKLIENLIKK
ncbi:helix-turn-helix domain-containing protein [Chryseobacterium antibioticum]|uniref:Helix-turn-helix domain-containing protein n=1 Tax=Chryseobacterium pyrolae TaxID=2987481 RepID=A0ABT2IME0_9FLAO|nr:helix-turn-helix domain-containing protein [Chryseobacterium pyrolae]MCT2409667.1 helix-turn-helix domain-containing protein [Chryseobacterium pyrolae]